MQEAIWDSMSSSTYSMHKHSGMLFLMVHNYRAKVRVTIIQHIMKKTCINLFQRVFAPILLESVNKTATFTPVNLICVRRVPGLDELKMCMTSITTPLFWMRLSTIYEESPKSPGRSLPAIFGEE